MDEFRVLLGQFWILREQDAALYHRVKRALPTFQKILGEQFGWKLFINEKLIKLEKISAHAEPSMGIEVFDAPSDYCLLCALLIFLEERDEGERFLLSELTPSLLAYLQPVLSDWNWETFSSRKSLVRVLCYAESLSLIKTRDGTSESFSSDQSQEVLYENTGLSRWFSVSFSYDISGFSCATDFEKEGAENLNQDRGVLRTHRVYRQLALSPAVYWEQPDDPVYAYIKNQRGWVQRYLDQTIGGNLQIYKNGAYFVLDEDESFGMSYPEDRMLSDIALNLSARLRSVVLENEYPRAMNDFVELSLHDFTRELEKCRTQYSALWGKQYREMSLEKLTEEVLSYMESWMLLSQREEGLALLPAAGKMTGNYRESNETEEV